MSRRESRQRFAQRSSPHRKTRLTITRPKLERVIDSYLSCALTECRKLRTCLRLQLRQSRARRHERGFRQRNLQAGALHRQAIGDAYAECGQHTGKRMDQYSAHARGPGHTTGVLTRRAPKTKQSEVVGVQPLPGGYLSDGI